MRSIPFAFLFALTLVVGAGCGVDDARVALVRHHEPSQGWSTDVPKGWVTPDLGAQFVRGLPSSDPTRLVLWTYRGSPSTAALREFAAFGGIVSLRQTGERTTRALRWKLYRGHARDDEALVVDVGVAREGQNAHVAALIARRAEAARLVDQVLLPALDGFVPGVPDPPASVLAEKPPDPEYWPTLGWRRATPASQGMDQERLDELVAAIEREKLQIDSVTVVRHGYVVLDVAFPPFSAGELDEPYATGLLHELHSATKSITSAVLGIALDDAKAKGADVDTPVLRLFAPYRPAETDARKRAMSLADLLTMQAGLAWTEWGAAYEPGTGNDLVAMVESAPFWSRYVLDRPMAAVPGTTYVYNSGASHLVSAAVSVLSGRSAADLAAERLFAPLGIRVFSWPAGPEGVTPGWSALALRPRDLAKLGYLYLHHGRWDGRTIVPEAWVERSTTDLIADPTFEYGYQWWLDRADGYAYMSGRYGQAAIVAPGADLVAVVTAHLPETMSPVAVPRWLFERFVLPAAG